MIKNWESVGCVILFDYSGIIVIFVASNIILT